MWEVFIYSPSTDRIISDCARPPEKKIWGWPPVRRCAKMAVLRQMEWTHPSTMSPGGVSWAISPTISLSAKTAHMLLMGTGRQSCTKSSRCEMLLPTRAIIISMKRPVPAAHLSFIKKSFTCPWLSRVMTLQSCPPISMTVSHRGPIGSAPLHGR